MGLIFSDLEPAFLGLGYSELAAPVGFALWLFIILIGIKKANPRKWMQAWLYSGFATFAGFVLVIALPQKYSAPISLSKAIVWFVIFWSISFSRWCLVMSKNRQIMQVTNE